MLHLSISSVQSESPWLPFSPRATPCTPLDPETHINWRPNKDQLVAISLFFSLYWPIIATAKNTNPLSPPK